MIITARGHFWLEFENGYTISVFNDWGSYTENHDNDVLKKSFMTNENKRIISETCEVAVIYKGHFVQMKNWSDSLKGHVTPNELLKIMNEVSKLEEK